MPGKLSHLKLLSSGLPILSHWTLAPCLPPMSSWRYGSTSTMPSPLLRFWKANPSTQFNLKFSGYQTGSPSYGFSTVLLTMLLVTATASTKSRTESFGASSTNPVSILPLSVLPLAVPCYVMVLTGLNQYVTS